MMSGVTHPSRRFAALSTSAFSGAIAGPLTIQATRAFVVDHPFLPPQKDIGAPVAISNANFRQIADLVAERGLLGTATL